MQTQLIVNLTSARGTMAQRYVQIEQLLRAENFSFETVHAERRDTLRNSRAPRST